MYLSELKLWNFRKYGNPDWDLAKPHLLVPFNSGTNVLIGENDSGKTAILDAIKYVLKTHAFEWIKIGKDDFYKNSDKLRIELFFEGFNDDEAKNFTEWLGWTGEGETAKPILRLILFAERNSSRILPYEVKAGMDEMGLALNADAKDYLKATYLKALRDANNELIAKKNSRLSQILQGHELFKQQGVEHDFEQWFSETNDKIKSWFNDDSGERSNKKQIKDVIDKFLKAFIDDSVSSELKLTEPEIKAILEKISLGIEGLTNLGLGTMNRLYMATELLHLKRDWGGLKLGVIEELEAHLHPQAQMKVIEALQNDKDVQFILTTHSPNLASKINLHNLILCKNNDVFPLGEDSGSTKNKTDKYTKLEKKDYKYLERFLDVTKSNLFFAKGVIIVEGWAEEILIPAIAKQIQCDLTKHEVSIVNVGSTAYLHFAKIFLRNDGKEVDIPVSVITDLDIRPNSKGVFDEKDEENKRKSINRDFVDFNKSKVILKIAKQWTLEWGLYKSPVLSKLFKQAVFKVHNKTDEFEPDDKGDFKPEFEAKFIQKLAKKEGTSPLDKVRIASELALLIEEEKPDFSVKDGFLEYIIDAIKHACCK